MTSLTLLLEAVSNYATIGYGLAGIGIGNIGRNGMDAIARQPEATGDIRSNMIIAAALVEAVALFANVVCLLVILMK